MNKLQLIVECTSEDLIKDMCTIKYRLPLIDAIVVEIEENEYDRLKKIDCIKSVYENTHITAQINRARNTVHASDTQGLTGEGITIAILDTGIAPMLDFTSPQNRILAFKDFVNNNKEPYDDNGHGTHVTGICAGNGSLSSGKYCGMAPMANIVSVKTLNNTGKGNSTDVLAGIQWVLDNKDKYNIRIVNLSIGTNNTSENDPLVKAAERLWDSGIVITTAAGNNGPSPCTISSPGISRKIITVGSSDDHTAVRIFDDTLVNFSGRGPTAQCVIKPDVVAPGTNIVSCLTPTPYSENGSAAKRIDTYYQSLSGTSMSTPIVTGAIALLLQKHPELKPDDIKYMLKLSCTDLKYPPNQQGWGLINVENLLSQEVTYVRH